MRSIIALIMLVLPGAALAQAAADNQAPLLTVNLTEDMATRTDMQAINAIIAAPSGSATADPAGKAGMLFGVSQVGERELATTHGLGLGDTLNAVTTNISQISGNKVGNNSATGNVTIADSAFQNLSGISIVNFNTGNNSSINAGMSVNLQIIYAPPAN